MSDILSKDLKVLKLNKHFWAVGFESVERAFSEMCSVNKTTGKHPRLAMDIVYAQREDGTYDTTTPLSYRPVPIEEWMLLPVRSCDLGINCSNRLIRVPRVTVCANYKDIPDKSPKFSRESLAARDGYRCQGTGKPLPLSEGTIGHDRARMHGGRRDFENTAWLSKEAQRLQGTKTFVEMGWPIKPKKPKSTKVIYTAKDVDCEDQLHFVN